MKMESDSFTAEEVAERTGTCRNAGAEIPRGGEV